MYIKAGENKSSRINYKTLMQKRIRRVLMICSSYDAYILEEDGRIEDQIYKEYLDLNLSNPPAFVWANSNLEALSLLENDSDFDLIISMFNVGTPTVFEFSKRCKNNYPDIPFILLINFSKELTRIIENEDCTAIDQIFSWHGNADLILAIIKLFEDRFNADEDILSAGVQSILLVEDSVRFYSTYLPAIYKLVLAQSAEFLKEALNEQQQKLRKRARPKILLATNYLEAVMLYEKYKKNLLGVISDVAFVISKNDPSSSEKLDAGIDLCKLIKSDDPYMPFLLQSSQEAIRSTATELRVGFILKHSKTLLIELTEYISEEFVFGDFVFRDLKNGEIIGRAKDLKDMEHLLMEIPSDVLLYHTSRNRLSKWMYSRGLFSLATKIRDVRQNQFSTLDQMRHFIVQSIIEYRIIIAQGIIARFDPKTYSQYIWFARLGEGSLGGKARGLAFLNRIIQKHELVDKYPGVKILVPRTVVVATDYFDEFIKENGLQYVINADISDEELLSEFVSSRLPEALVDELRFFLEYSTGPLAVRSSSKLEDSHYQPFAGIYSTYMIPHTQNQDQMLRLLGKAIKSVYASIYFASSKTYIQATSNLISEEKMAVVIQDICGTEDKGHFFPTISGVARSVNYYPIGDEKPEEGIVNLAYGLGRLVVEGGKTLRFSPAHPKHVLQLSTDSMALRETQNEMYALDLQPEQFKTSIDESINLKRFDINQTKEFRNIKYVASTWDAQSEMLIDNSLAEGRKVITFAHILKYDTLPLAEIVTYLLEICQREMCMAIELEFSVNMDVPKGEDAIFNLLQIRPITESQDNKSLDWEHIDTSDSLIYAEKALGVGLVEGVTDMIYVREENFDNSFTMQIAEEIGQLNSILKQEKRDCVLLGPGRWGTSDMFLGIPVKWSHISQAKVIVECGMENFRVEPSQGTHFFQNLTSFGIGYLTINPFMGDGKFDRTRVNSMETVYESKFLRHIRFKEPLYIFIDGRENRGIVKLPS
ncbi:MAG: PEP/pyruvate-binding domain-containing protein [Bacteroidales bacterium]|nr:PEP/pyruvate-binding domain-containing protein [Bacteroidales bacterium]MDD3990205.1 PEP/pyruvate-binding domain-containing protein [Bacteroidales bacterium]